MAERIMMDGRSLPERVGDVAGRVWRQLRAHGPQTTHGIAQAIGRSEVEVHQAVGWLAREGKLRFDPSDQKLSLMEHEMSIGS
jgi:hypothetical protein